MESATDLINWKKSLALLEESEGKIDQKIIGDLAKLFEHLTTQTAPRLQKEHRQCTSKSEILLAELFDKIEVSDNRLLCSYLQMLRSFGYFRLAQIVHYVEGPLENQEPDPTYNPIIVKTKWYDLCPLMPEAGTVGWKGIVNHGLVKEEPELFRVCLQLLSQKLHFFSVISSLNRFRDSLSIIKRNGKKVATKLFELIRDTSCDDESVIGIDTALFNLLKPFIDSDQQSAIVEATVRDLFKPVTLEKTITDEDLSDIYALINTRFNLDQDLQDVVTTKFIEHLKCNIIRRKRRHSLDEENESDGSVTLESLLAAVISGVKPIELLSQTQDVEVSSKGIQSKYLSYWIDVVDRSLPERILSGQNAVKLIGACSVLLVTAANVITVGLARDLAKLMSKIIENIAQNRLRIIFAQCNSQFLTDFTKILSERTSLLSAYDAPLQLFYKSYLNRHLRYSLLSFTSDEAENLAQFLATICDKSMGREPSHLLQYAFVQELADCFDTKGKLNNKVVEVFMGSARACAKRLYKFIKRHSLLKTDSNGENGDDIESSDLNSSSESITDVKKVVVTDALICILRIAIVRKDQDILDRYSDLLLKLFSFVTNRVEKLVQASRKGIYEPRIPIDHYIPRLLMIYMIHKDMVKAYLNYDLLPKIAQVLTLSGGAAQNGNSAEVMNCNKKMIYNQIKTKLETLEERASKSTDVYQTIINKQYNIVVDQIVCSTSEIHREKSCYHGYRHQLKTVKEVSTFILANCEPTTYETALEAHTKELEECDPLDHPKLLFTLLMIESLVPNRQLKESRMCNMFKERMTRISCSLIRITKSVELGPSIHAFTRAGSHRSNRGIQCCTYANCIKIHSLIFLRYPAKTTNPLINDAMQICVSSNLTQYAKYTAKLHNFFIQLASAIAGLLKSICIGRKDEDILKSSMPIFLSMLSHLMRCLIMASDRRTLEDVPRAQTNGHAENGDVDMIDAEVLTDGTNNSDNVSREYETQLELLALDVGRTLNNLSFLRVKLVNYAPHLISTYVKDVQRASCPDYVRQHLNEGMFRIFNLVDAHQKERQEGIIEEGVQRKLTAGRATGSLFEMIHARLDQASREIFRDMHENYNKFHRYLGKC